VARGVTQQPTKVRLHSGLMPPSPQDRAERRSRPRSSGIATTEAPSFRPKRSRVEEPPCFGSRERQTFGVRGLDRAFRYRRTRHPSAASGRRPEHLSTKWGGRWAKRTGRGSGGPPAECPRPLPGPAGRPPPPGGRGDRMRSPSREREGPSPRSARSGGV